MGEVPSSSSPSTSSAVIGTSCVFPEGLVTFALMGAGPEAVVSTIISAGLPTAVPLPVIPDPDTITLLMSLTGIEKGLSGIS